MADGYRTEVEKQMQADEVEVRDVSERTKAALSRVAGAKDDRERAEAFKRCPQVSQDIAAFKASVEARFGEDGAREMLRAAAAGKTFQHPFGAEAQQDGLGKVAISYSAASAYTERRGSNRLI